MPETIIQSAISGKLDWDLLSKWLNNESIEAAPEDCILFCSNRNEFVGFFLSYLRNQTENVLQTNSNALPIPQHQGTPEKSLVQRKHHRSVSEPTCDNDISNDSLTVKSDRKTQESPNRERRKPGRRVKTKLFPEDKKEHNISLSSDESRISTGVERLVLSSTPLKTAFKPDYSNLPSSSPVTPHSRSFKEFERCDTPRISRHSRSQEKSVSLADYLVNVQSKSSKKRRSKNTSNDDSETKMDLDLSNSEIFPEIGTRKSSSLKSDRRRIKPTNIDRSKKSYSLNSFTPEAFQQPSPLALEENLAFKPKLQPKELSNGIEVERNILKQERQKLMEKFNVLNTSLSPKVTTPQIKVTQKDLSERNLSCVEADQSKIAFIEKIDILIDIYNILLKNNLILSINTEIYFLITILLSKQLDEDYRISESQLQINLYESILKPIHNSTYFAVKSLWNQRSVLEVILDKNSLKILGENKKVRSFYPDLAKFLLNSYGLKCEAESNSDRSKTSESRGSNGMVCFNHETDNSENFPSILSFQNFKKQRDMFYEILRWYSSGGGGGAALRTRTRALLALAARAHNHAHLAALLTRMLLDAPAPESKLSKLQRRLTCPSATESHRLPHFSDKEMFYKEFIMYAENESFRVHLKDALASEILALDATGISNESSNGSDLTREYLLLSKKLCLLSKFLGYLTSLPYVQTSVDILLKSGALPGNNYKEEIFAAPKEKVLENGIALRNYSQPTIDLNGILRAAIDNGRMTITVPWIVHYLSMLDYTTLRLNYYQNLLNLLFGIYEKILKYNEFMKKNTIIYMKSILGWLFDLPHFPQEFFNHKRDVTFSVAREGFDSCDLVDESTLFELCPFLRDVNVLLSTSRVNHEKESFRHITPVSLTLNTEDRIRNKEKELQSRLEEELLRSQPSSSRRVLELVSERVCSAAVRELAAALAAARARARAAAAALVAQHADRATLIPTLQAMYAEHLDKLRSEALESCKSIARSRISSALTALLPNSPAPLHAVATRTCYNRLSKWINDHWTTTAVLCKDIEQEAWSLRVSPDSPPAQVAPPPNLRDLCSPAAALIALKEHICLLLEDAEAPPPAGVLRACAASCAPHNVFTRPPTQRAILQLSIDFCIVYVSRKTMKILEVLPDLHELWNTCCPDRPHHDEGPESPERRPDLSPTDDYDDRAPTPQSDDDGKIGEVNAPAVERPPLPVAAAAPEAGEAGEAAGALAAFARVLCARNVRVLGGRAGAWAALAHVLLFLLTERYLAPGALAETCLALYSQDWPQDVLTNLSTCMKTVSSGWSSSSGGKFTLFLDFLADYCNDMDFEIIE
ncbi:codanin-1 isoform X1 [Vanessa atalanta]|uniref:codanin-1 isoform X1 n=1 Tax=Vanessa atalanta TaxID=42275 RepID=UPI001FCD6C32|nr:codanin-1 isoform X1 [Vanessa atalanta]